MYVAFVDLLGFASAVEGLTDEQADIFTCLVSETVSGSDSTPISIHRADPPVRKLYELYQHFQKACERAAWRLSQFSAYTRYQANAKRQSSSNDRSSLAEHRAIVFSDSLFLASSALEPVFDAAGEVITSLILQGVPSRGAIAKGHFHTFEWNMRAGLSNSFHASAPFVGSGVIRAYRTESKGPRGIRLLIHESCREDLRVLNSWSAIPLPSEELSEEWKAEANFGQFTPLDNLFNLEVLRDEIGRMSEDANEHVQNRHYAPTLAAFSRMLGTEYSTTDHLYSRLDNWRNDE